VKRALLRTPNSDIEPFEFERPVSRACDIGRGWDRTLPESLRLDTDWLSVVNRTIDLTEIEKIYRANMERLHEPHGWHTVIPAPLHRRHVSGFIIFSDNVCAQAFEALSGGRVKLDKHTEAVLPATESDPPAQQVLRDLGAMREEEDEPDFMHRPTDDAYDLARRFIERVYTHCVDSAPVPAVAPDGDGGVIVEWQSGRRTVRLVVPASKDENSYVYSKRENDPSEMDDPATDLDLAKRLRTIFVD
jgi:hypothetical protein